MAGVTAIDFGDYLERNVIDFDEQIAAFRHGKCYIAEDSYDDKSAADTPFADMDVKATELSTYYSELSDLAEKPGKEESKVEKLKTSNHIIEGKRSNMVEIYLVGLSQSRKDWLEDELNGKTITVLLESDDGRNVIIFNGLKWTYERSSEFNGLYNATISTEYSGLSIDKYFIYKNIPDAAA